MRANKELLDYLAATFVEGGWSIKKMHRAIMLSNTYQQSTRYDAAAAKVDPQNKLLWRYNRHRLEGEVIRDSMLEVSGRLNLKTGGPGVFPPLPPGVVTRGGWKKEANPSEGERRSVYVFVRRNTRYPMLEVFDLATAQETCPRRDVTTIAPQALTVLNDKLSREWAEAFAGATWLTCLVMVASTGYADGSEGRTAGPLRLAAPNPTIRSTPASMVCHSAAEMTRGIASNGRTRSIASPSEYTVKVTPMSANSVSASCARRQKSAS